MILLYRVNFDLLDLGPFKMSNVYVSFSLTWDVIDACRIAGVGPKDVLIISLALSEECSDACIDIE